MKGMFTRCQDLEQSFENWNMEKVQNINNMFYYCNKLSGSLEKWKLDNVKDFVGIYSHYKTSDCEIKFRQKVNFPIK